MRIKTCASLLSLAAAASCATDPVVGPPPVPQLPATSVTTNSKAPVAADTILRPVVAPKP